MTDDTDHTLFREVVETRQYSLHRSEDGGLEIDHDMDAHLMDYDEKATIECTCGARFRKDETALAHLRDVGEIDD